VLFDDISEIHRSDFARSGIGFSHLRPEQLSVCGICGLIARDTAQLERSVRRMMQAMTHRGPDDEGCELLATDNQETTPVGFGFRRLSILDLTTAGHQPMFNPKTGDCLVFNGEIYNYRKLRTQLMVEGCRPHSSGDSEVLLNALSLWGESALFRIEGMFALAFYHASTKRILLARDPLGIKPLYYSGNDERFIFASEVKPLLASGLVAKDLDPAGIASFLTYGAPQDPLTVHRDIRSFPAGSYRWISLHGESTAYRALEPVPFWRFSRANARVDSASAIREVRLAFDESVAEHLQADVPTGVFLSAGIDSTIVAATARRIIGKLNTYSVGFSSRNMRSETDLARETARQLGTSHTEVLLDERDLPSLWKGWLEAADRPSVDGFNTYIVCKAVRDAQITVALSGLGADEFFGGYQSFARVRRLSPMLLTLSRVPDLVRRTITRLAKQVMPRRHHARIDLLAEAAGSNVRVALAFKKWLDARALADLGLTRDALGLNDDFLPPDAYDALGDYDPEDCYESVSRVESCHYMGNTLLRDADINSMAHSIELRVPFLSQRLVQTASRYPGPLHRGPSGIPKYLLRSALSEVIPQHVLQRPKTGFTLPLTDWMFGSLRESCESAVESLADVPFLDQPAILRLWKEFSDHPGENYWMKPMLLVSLGSYVGSLRRIP